MGEVVVQQPIDNRDVSFDIDYLKLVIEENNKDAFYGGFEEDEFRQDHYQVAVKKEILEYRLGKIIAYSQEDSEYHQNGLFLKEIFERLLNAVEDEEILLSDIFKSDEEKERFFELAGEYVITDLWSTIINRIAEECPSRIYFADDYERTVNGNTSAGVITTTEDEIVGVIGQDELDSLVGGSEE